MYLDIIPCGDLTIITGAFGAHPNHDAHLLSTLSAIQILVTQNALDRIDKGRVVKCDFIQHSFLPFNLTQHNTPVILLLQQPSGVFAGDAFGETDTRFLYCAVNALSLLDRLDEMNKYKAVEYIERCRNYDGGFGSSVGAESHAAQGAVHHLLDFGHVLLSLNHHTQYLCAWLLLPFWTDWTW